MRPTDLQPDEVTYWSNMETLEGHVLDELRTAKVLKDEKEWDRAALAQLAEMNNRFNGHMNTATALSTAFESKRAEVTKCLTELKVGFTSQNVATTWVYDVLGVFVESTELLKNYLLFLLRMDGDIFNMRMPLGPLMSSIENQCPTSGSAFHLEVKVKLRNALSHGLYWFQKDSSGNDVFHYVEEFGATSKTLTSSQLRESVKKSNLLVVSFVDVIGDRATKGYFKGI